MNLRPFHLLGLIGLATLQADCIPDCAKNLCAPSLDLQGWCVDSNACKVNGLFVATCQGALKCPFLEVEPGNTIEFPMEEIWPVLGPRNDLMVTWSYTFGDVENVELFFDGVPEAEGMCQRVPGKHSGAVSCPNLPSTLKRLEFRYAPSASGGTSSRVYLDMGDSECAAANPVCPV